MSGHAMRLFPRARSSLASGSALRRQCRMMHASSPLDPAPHSPPEASIAGTTQLAASSADPATSLAGSSSLTQESMLSEAFVHVKLAYLHPSTKDAVKVPRPEDIERGRVRAEPQYVPLSSYVFGIAPRRDVLHSAVVFYLDGLRAGTASTKSRGEVAFSGRKLSPQKGTGRARRGTRGSPLLRKGGVAHGPKPRDFSTKLNRRVRELALRSALSLRWQSGDMHVVKNLFWQPPPHSTRPLALLLKTKGWDDALFLTAPRHPQPGTGMGRTKKPSAVDPIYDLAAVSQHAKDIRDFAIALANIQRTELVALNDLTPELRENPKKEADTKRPGEIHAYEVLARKKLICDVGAIEWLEEKLGGSIFHEAMESGTMTLEELSDDAHLEGIDLAGLNLAEVEAAEQVEAEDAIDERSEEQKAEDEEIRAAEDAVISEEVDRVLDGVENTPAAGDGRK